MNKQVFYSTFSEAYGFKPVATALIRVWSENSIKQHGSLSAYTHTHTHKVKKVRESTDICYWL